MTKTKKIILSCLGMCMASFLHAEVTQNTALQSLKDRVARLEQQMLSGAPVGEKHGMLCRYGVTFYGYIKVDAGWNFGNNTVRDPNSVSTVNRLDNSSGRPDRKSEFSMTARQTRFGFNLDLSEVWCGKVTGNIEVDFYGGEATCSTKLLRLRHAYLTWKKCDWTVIAGRTTYPIKLVCCDTINFGGYMSGNPCDNRAPQLTVAKTFDPSCFVSCCETDTKITAKVGLVALERCKWKSYCATTHKLEEVSDKWYYARMPAVQGALYATNPFFVCDKEVKVGIVGSFGQIRADDNLNADVPNNRYYGQSGKTYNTWIIGASAILPVKTWLTLKGHLFYGANMAPYGGSMFGQGINPRLRKEIRGNGGFAQVTITPPCMHDKVVFNFGIIFENPHKYLEPGFVTRQLAIYANTEYFFNKDCSIGLEYGRIRTSFEPGRAVAGYPHRVGQNVRYGSVYNHRVQAMLKHKF